MTVIENVQMALVSRDRQLFNLWKPASSIHADEAIALLEQVGMAAHAKRACGVLAYGDVKRVELAIALANRPKLLLMDEPTAGMAPKERNDLMALTKQLVIDHKIGVLFTEHSMDVVFAYADKHDRARARQADWRGRRRNDPQRSACAGSVFRHRQDLSRRVRRCAADGVA